MTKRYGQAVLSDIFFSPPPALCVYIDVYRCVGELMETDWLSEPPALSKLSLRTFVSQQIPDRIELLTGNYTGECILLLPIWVCVRKNP